MRSLEESAKATIKKVELANAQIQTYSARFTQTYIDIAAGSSKTILGSVYLKKPDRIRWISMDTKNPKVADKEYISDGVSFWSYEHALNQVLTNCTKDYEIMPHLKLLMGLGDFLKTFNVTFADKNTKAKPLLKLIPKKKTSLYKEVRFTLNPKTFHIVKTEIFDPYGNSTEYAFSQVRINKKLPNTGFALKMSKSMRRLNPKKKCQ